MKKIFSSAFILIVFPSLSFAGLQTYIISNKQTRQIVSQGRVNIERDQEWIANGDTSTTYESILKRLESDINLQVLYLPKGNLVDSKKHKINQDNTKSELKTQDDLEKEEKEKKIKDKENKLKQLKELQNINQQIENIEDEIKDLKK
jgi:HD superfamily phosphohydrolase